MGVTAEETGVLQLSRPGGRTLGWCAYGASDGRPVLAFHGAPACRLLFQSAAGAASRLGLRLIAPDRPGYGHSDPQSGRTLADWSADAAALMDHQGIAEAPILAISGGAPYAVAAASHLGQRISGLALVSPLGEVGAPASREHTSRMARGFFLGLPRAPALLRRAALAGRAAFLATPGFAMASFAATLSPPDRRYLSSPAGRRLFVAMTREALRQGVDGGLSDMALYAQPWGVDLATITTPAILWQGTADHVVPAGLAFDLAARLADCRLHRLQGAGHFWGLEHVDEILRAVAALPCRA